MSNWPLFSNSNRLQSRTRTLILTFLASMILVHAPIKQTCAHSSILVNAFTFAIHSEKQWMHSIHHSFWKKVNHSIHHSFENESIHFQFIFNSWNHATLFIFMRWFCLISCECRSARLLRNWRRFSRRFFRSRSSTKIEFRN